MKETYGSDEGERVFYALLEKRRRQGKGRGLREQLRRK